MDARCRDRLLAAGFKGIFHEDWRTRFHGELPDRWRNRRRGGEIAEWLSRHPEVSVYAIVDDDSDMLPEQRHAFVQTRFEDGIAPDRSEEHTSELQSLMRISYAVFCLNKKKNNQIQDTH